MLINKDKACLIISCMQKEFLPTLKGAQALVDSCSWLIDLAGHFNIPVILVNHKKLGEPIETFLNYPSQIISTETMMFSCVEDEKIKKIILKTGKTQFLLAGSETHISILQTAHSFIGMNMDSYVIQDAVSARNEVDHKTALNRLNAWNIPVITKEMIFFELIRKSEYPNYINLSLKFLDQRYMRY